MNLRDREVCAGTQRERPEAESPRSRIKKKKRIVLYPTTHLHAHTALRRCRSRAGGLPREHFDHAEVRDTLHVGAVGARPRTRCAVGRAGAQERVVHQTRAAEVHQARDAPAAARARRHVAGVAPACSTALLGRERRRILLRLAERDGRVLAHHLIDALSPFIMGACIEATSAFQIEQTSAVCRSVAVWGC